jgi:hypothetical protein
VQSPEFLLASLVFFPADAIAKYQDVSNSGLDPKPLRAGSYALGDVKGGPAFTHISYDDFHILRTNLLERGGASTQDRLVPYTIFIDPQLARVGMSENEAEKRDATSVWRNCP